MTGFKEDDYIPRVVSYAGLPSVFGKKGEADLFKEAGRPKERLLHWTWQRRLRPRLKAVAQKRACLSPLLCTIQLDMLAP